MIFHKNQQIFFIIIYSLFDVKVYFNGFNLKIYPRFTGIRIPLRPRQSQAKGEHIQYPFLLKGLIF